MSLQQQIKDQVKEAMKAKDAVRLGVLRGLTASFINELVNLKRMPSDELSDDEVLAVIRRSVKQRKDSIDQFIKGGREDLAGDEKAELAVLETFLPALMNKEDIKKIAEAKKAEMGVTDKAGMGKFMGALMKDLAGKADGAEVKEVVEGLF